MLSHQGYRVWHKATRRLERVRNKAAAFVAFSLCGAPESHGGDPESKVENIFEYLRIQAVLSAL
jgi:hypothetical protein